MKVGYVSVCPDKFECASLKSEVQVCVGLLLLSTQVANGWLKVIPISKAPGLPDPTVCLLSFPRLCRWSQNWPHHSQRYPPLTTVAYIGGCANLAWNKRISPTSTQQNVIVFKLQRPALCLNSKECNCQQTMCRLGCAEWTKEVEMWRI